MLQEQEWKRGEHKLKVQLLRCQVEAVGIEASYRENDISEVVADTDSSEDDSDSDSVHRIGSAMGTLCSD